ncbi:MAG TPA: nuclear transport factor 2 family protein [Gemmatimonadaceae bacterium]
MKRSQIFLGVIILTVAGLPITEARSAHATATPRRAPSDSMEAQVVAREREGWDAIVRKDFEAYGRTLAPEYHEIGPEGYHDRALALRSIRGMQLARYTMVNVKVARVAPDIAILTYRGTLFGTFLGKPMQTAPFSYHNIYVKRNAVWLSVFGEETSVP